MRRAVDTEIHRATGAAVSVVTMGCCQNDLPGVGGPAEDQCLRQQRIAATAIGEYPSWSTQQEPPRTPTNNHSIEKNDKDGTNENQLNLPAWKIVKRAKPNISDHLIKLARSFMGSAPARRLGTFTREIHVMAAGGNYLTVNVSINVHQRAPLVGDDLGYLICLYHHLIPSTSYS